MLTKRSIQSFDVLLVMAMTGLIIFGIVAIGSADHINIAAENRDNFNKQIIFFVTGVVLMLAAAFIDYAYFSQFFIAFYIINILLLIAVLLFGKNVNNATRWIVIGPATFQPSEFSKIIMIYCNAKIIDKVYEKMNNILMVCLMAFLTMIPIALIIMQPSLSASLVLLAILATQLFVAKVNIKFFIAVGLVGISAVLLVFWDVTNETHIFVDKFLKDYQILRILALRHPEDYPSVAYQTVKSIQAIGSGQLYGKGLYQGTLNQLSYLPEPNNDFIFSVIGEEFGFAGCITVLGLLMFVIGKCIWIARNSKERLGQLIASGVAGMLAFQTFVNAGVATGLLPNTGMSLPFVSSGGSALWANMIGIGLVLNIGMKKPKSLFEGGS